MKTLTGGPVRVGLVILYGWVPGVLLNDGSRNLVAQYRSQRRPCIQNPSSAT